MNASCRFAFLISSLAFVASVFAGDIVLSTFEEQSLTGWSSTGDVFSIFRPGAKGRFRGFQGDALVWSGRSGVEATGTLLSADFKIERPYINFMVSGARDLAANLGAELLVDGRVVRSASATEWFDSTLCWRTWEVREFAGRTARIRVNDNSTTDAIAVDEFRQSDAPRIIPTDSTKLLHETLRPQFHFTAKTGWLNDANGMFYYKGKWHLFHQHRPPQRPATVWGHAISEDLLHWSHQPTAIASEDKDAIFSGSGFVDFENASGLRRGEDPAVLQFYTLHPPAKSGRKATQCMAFSTDGGKTFQQSPNNPILCTEDFNDRDPKAFFHKPTGAFFMVLSLSCNNIHRDKATYGLFRSRDLKNWELLQKIGPGSWYWECPDMFEMAVAGSPQRTKWILMKGSGDYIIGEFDGNRFKPETEPIRTNWGGNFYGAQTFSDAPSGRRIQIGWMNFPKTQMSSCWPGMPFNQQMSFPREFTLRETPEGLRIFREPVAEIAKLYARTTELPAQRLEPGKNPLSNIQNELLDMEIEIEPKEAAQISLTLRNESIVYDVKQKKLKVSGRVLPVELTEGRLVLRVLLDRTSIELFANRGATSHSLVFFPKPEEKSISLGVTDGSAELRRLVVHELRSIWPE